MKMTHQFILSIFIPTLIVCLVAAVFTTTSLSSHVRLTTQETLQNQVSKYASDVNELLSSLSHNAQFIKNFVETSIDLKRFQNDLEYREDYLNQLTVNINVMARKSGLPTGYFVTFAPQLTDSLVIAGAQDYDDNGSLEPLQPLSIRYFTTAVNEPDKDWYFKPIQEGKAFWAGPSVKKYALIGHEYVSISTPIFYKGQTIGVAVAEVDFSTLEQLVNRFHFHTNGYAMVTDARYTFLVHPTYSREERLITVENNRYAFMKKTLDAYDSGILELTPPQANEQVMAYTSLRNQWFLYLVADKSDILSTVGQLTSLTYSLFAFAILLSLLLSWAMGRRMAKPLTQLSLFLNQAIKSEAPSASNDLMLRSDDIGILAKAIFNMNQTQHEMTLKIDDYTHNLNEKVNLRNKDLLAVNADLQETRKMLELQQNELREKNTILEETINEMMYTQAQLIHSEKMASFGYLISGIADEIDIPVEGSLKLIQKMKVLHETQFSPLDTEPFPEEALKESLALLQSYNAYLLKYMYFSKDIIDYIKDIVHSKTNQKRIPILLKDALIQSGESAIQMSTREGVHLVVKCPDTLCIQSDPALFSHVLFSIFMTIINDLSDEEAHYMTVRALEEGQDLRLTVFASSKEKSREDDLPHSHGLPSPDADIRTIKIGFNMIHILMQAFFNGDFKFSSDGPSNGVKFTLLFREVI